METETKKKINLVFGYGSIRNDLGRYGRVPFFLESRGFGRINRALYRIENIGGIWAGVNQNEHGNTYGEVFEFKKGSRRFGLRNLDYREGYLQLTRFKKEISLSYSNYLRRVIDVTLDSGEKVKAYVYFINPNRARLLNRIEGDDWKNALKDRKNWNGVCY